MLLFLPGTPFLHPPINTLLNTHHGPGITWTTVSSWHLPGSSIWTGRPWLHRFCLVLLLSAGAVYPKSPLSCPSALTRLIFTHPLNPRLTLLPRAAFYVQPITVSSHMPSQVTSHLCLYQIIVLHCHCCTSSHPTRLLADGDSHYNWGSSLDPQYQAYRMAESKCSGSISWIVKLPLHEMLTTVVVNSLLLEIEFHDLQSKTLVWCHQYS